MLIRSFHLDDSILPILEQLRSDLPWALRASKVFGGDTDKLNESLTPKDLERPSNDKVTAPPEDAFNNTLYTPGDYSGTAGGDYSIPNVGSHVYVFFKGGNTNFPVYFAASHGTEELKAIFKTDYPSTYENENNTSEVYQNKHVLNTSKHTLEFIDTDELEEVKLSHFSGSNIQMKNEYVSAYSVLDNYTLVDGSEFLTIRKDSATNIDGSESIVVKKDATKDITGNDSLTIGKDQTINISGNLNIKVAGSITIESANGKIVLDSSGVKVTGNAINLN